MSNAFACVALYPWFEWAPALIWMCEAAIRSVDWAATVMGVSGIIGTKLTTAMTCIKAASSTILQQAFGKEKTRTRTKRAGRNTKNKTSKPMIK